MHIKCNQYTVELMALKWHTELQRIIIIMSVCIPIIVGCYNNESTAGADASVEVSKLHNIKLY